MSAFGRLVVKDGGLDPQLGRSLRRLFERRNVADYDGLDEGESSSTVADPGEIAQRPGRVSATPLAGEQRSGAQRTIASVGSGAVGHTIAVRSTARSSTSADRSSTLDASVAPARPAHPPSGIAERKPMTGYMTVSRIRLSELVLSNK